MQDTNIVSDIRCKGCMTMQADQARKLGYNIQGRKRNVPRGWREAVVSGFMAAISPDHTCWLNIAVALLLHSYNLET
jgi:hypothetical protein